MNQVDAYGNAISALASLDLNNRDIGPDKATIQKLTVARAYEILQSSPVVLLADEVGMGKTFEALGLIFVLAHVCLQKKQPLPRVLILVPSISLRKKWENDARKFSEKCIKQDLACSSKIKASFSNPLVFEDTSSYETITLGEEYSVAIATVHTVLHRLRRRKWDVIVVDEAHKFRNPSSARSALFLGKDTEEGKQDGLFSNIFDKLILVSATPFQLEPEEIGNILQLGTASRLSNQGESYDHKSRIESLVGTLAEYKKKISQFESAWSSIPRELGKNVAYSLADGELNDSSLSKVSSSFIDEFSGLYQEAKDASSSLSDHLSKYVIRNRKFAFEAGYRKTISGSFKGDKSGVSLSHDEQLFYLHVNRFVHDLAGKLFSVQILQETTSSYKTLGNYSINAGKFRDSLSRINPKVCEESERLTQAIKFLLDPSNRPNESSHPKTREMLGALGLVRESGDQLPKSFDKTLIFCRFVETANSVRDGINRSFRQYRDALVKEILPDFERKPSGEHRYTSRFDGLLRRKEQEVLEGLAPIYVQFPNMSKLMEAVRRFKIQTKSGKVRCELRRIKDEFERIVKSKVKEDYLLFLIMLQYKQEIATASSDEKSNVMLRCVKTVLEKEVFPVLRAQLKSFENDFDSTRSEDSINKLMRLVDGLRREKFAASLTGQTKDLAQERMIEAFNLPFNPRMLVVTQVAEEGIDLQKQCSRVIHYDLWWNPAVMEQRVGRVDRVGGKILSDLFEYQKKRQGEENPVEEMPLLRIYEPYIRRSIDEDIVRVLRTREKWFQFIIGRRYSKGEKKLSVEQLASEASISPLPDRMTEELSINLSARPQFIKLSEIDYEPKEPGHGLLGTLQERLKEFVNTLHSPFQDSSGS